MTRRGRGVFACVPRRCSLLILALLVFLSLAGLVTKVALPVMGMAYGTRLPVIMYHSVLNSRARSGQYVISVDVVRTDFEWIKTHGYTAVLPSELYDAVSKGRPLPEKPVMITLDDGFLNNLTYLLPLLEEFDFKAVVAVVGSYSERFTQNHDPNPAYAYLSWDEINKLLDSGRIEIANHSYDMHRQNPRHGVKRLLGEDAQNYYAALVKDVGNTQSLLEQNCGILPTAFAYPFGAVNRESRSILMEMGFTSLFTCEEKVNILTGKTDELLSLGRFNRAAGDTTSSFMKRTGIT